MRRRKLLPINQTIIQTSELSQKIPDVSKVETGITNQTYFSVPVQPINNSNDEATQGSPMIKDIHFYPDPTNRP